MHEVIMKRGEAIDKYAIMDDKNLVKKCFFSDFMVNRACIQSLKCAEDLRMWESFIAMRSIEGRGLFESELVSFENIILRTIDGLFKLVSIVDDFGLMRKEVFAVGSGGTRRGS